MKPLSTRVITAAMATFPEYHSAYFAIGTSILAGVILGWQITSWMLTGEWNPFPISSALALAHVDRTAIYVTASVSERSCSLDIQTIYDWFLDLPAGGFLLAVVVVLLGFSIIGASVEMQFTTTASLRSGWLLLEVFRDPITIENAFILDHGRNSVSAGD
jgi:hypothetical protein